ncbi:MAG: hydrogen peroxide-inducible genes activator [Pseudomonadota bacterium]
MNGLTLKHLRYLSALAEHRHFGRAAQACAITQPALSIQIKDLEALVDAPLVERDTRQIRLTQLGQALVAKAQTILGEIDEIEGLVRAARGRLTGEMRLGVIPTIAPYLLPRIVMELETRFPALDILPREAITSSLVSDLLDYNLDAAIVSLPIQEPRLQEMALFEEDFVLVRAPEDAGRPIPGVAELKAMRLLLLGEGHCFRDQAIALCDLPTPGREILQGSSLSTLVQMVGAGIGVTLIPEMAIGFETGSARVSVERFAEQVPRRSIGMVWRKSNPMAEQLSDIGEILRALGPPIA